MLAAGNHDTVGFKSDGPVVATGTTTTGSTTRAAGLWDLRKGHPVNQWRVACKWGYSVSPTPILESSGFSDPDGDTQAASQWQITVWSGNYSSPVFDSRTDTASDQCHCFFRALTYSTAYYCRVRSFD